MMQPPPKAEQRPHVLSCRCNQLEAQLIRTLAARDNVTVSDYIRTAALAGVEQFARELSEAAG